MGSKRLSRFINHISAPALRVFLAAVLTLGGCLLLPGSPAPTQAFAEPVTAAPEKTDTQPVKSELQQRVEDTAAAYNESLAKLADIELQITSNQKEISTITEQLASQREKSSLAAAELYRTQRSGNTILELIFSAQSISELAAKFEYFARLQDSFYLEINRLDSLSLNLDEARQALEVARGEAEEESRRAEEALSDAKAAREEARLQAEAAAADQALRANMPVPTPSHTPPAPVENPENPDKGDDNKKIDEGDLTDRASFVEYWAPKLNAYLAGYPLGGYGKNFAEAAWDYGVDPRVGAAISCNESGKGRVCFLPHNAWGWGQYSWPDWPTAIDKYTAGFARGYGYVITLESSKRYAPECWERWYPIIVGEMNIISSM